MRVVAQAGWAFLEAGPSGALRVPVTKALAIAERGGLTGVEARLDIGCPAIGPARADPETGFGRAFGRCGPLASALPFPGALGRVCPHEVSADRIVILPVKGGSHRPARGTEIGAAILCDRLAGLKCRSLHTETATLHGDRGDFADDAPEAEIPGPSRGFGLYPVRPRGRFVARAGVSWADVARTA